MYPTGPRKKVRKKLRKLMKYAERVRSADIAIELLEDARLRETDTLVLEIRSQRDYYRAELHEELTALAGHPYTKTWRAGLGL